MLKIKIKHKTQYFERIQTKKTHTSKPHFMHHNISMINMQIINIQRMSAKSIETRNNPSSVTTNKTSIYSLSYETREKRQKTMQDVKSRTEKGN